MATTYSLYEVTKFDAQAIAEMRIYGMDPTAAKVLCKYDGAYNAWSAARKLTRIHKEVCDEFGKETYKRYGVSRSLDISI